MSSRPSQLGKAELVARLQGKRPQTARHTVVLNADAVEAATAAKTVVDRLELFRRPDDDPELMQARADLDAATATAEGAVVELVLHALPRDVYEALQLRYPPTDEQKAKDHEYDADRLMPALIAATVVEDAEQVHRVTVKDLDGFDTTPLPGRLFTAAEVSELIGDWNLAETTGLWNAAITVCSRVRNPTLPFASRPTAASR